MRSRHAGCLSGSAFARTPRRCERAPHALRRGVRYRAETPKLRFPPSSQPPQREAAKPLAAQPPKSALEQPPGDTHVRGPASQEPSCARRAPRQQASAKPPQPPPRRRAQGALFARPVDDVVIRAALVAHKSHGPATRSHPQSQQCVPSDVTDGTDMQRRWLSAVGWLELADGARRDPHPANVVNTLRALARVPEPEIAARHHDVCEALRGVIAAVDMRSTLTKVLDVLGSAVRRHPCLRLSMASQGGLRAIVQALFDEAAAAGDTYSDDKSATQMATAQRKLAMYCKPFWVRLEGAALSGYGSQAVATLLHRAVSLAVRARAPPPSARLWARLLRAVRGAAVEASFGAREAANCLWAIGKAVDNRMPAAMQPAVQSDQLACVDALLGAAERTAGRMAPHEAAHVWWAVSVLNSPLRASQRQVLLAAVVREAPRMQAQAISITLLAFARLSVSPLSEAGHAVLKAAALRAECFSQHAAAITWWALVRAGAEPDEVLLSALLRATERTADDARPQAVSLTLWAMAMLRLDVPLEVQTVLGAAVERTANEMDPQGVANTIWALGKLQLEVPPDAQHACLAAAQRMAPRAAVSGIVQTLEGLAAVGWCTSHELRNAVLRAAERLVPSMSAQTQSQVEDTLARLQWPLSEDVHAALCSAAECLPHDDKARALALYDQLRA